MLDIDSISFTPNELKAIEILTSLGHKVVSYRDLIKYIWCCEWDGDLRALQVVISRMRGKLRVKSFDIERRNGGYLLVAK